MKRFALDGNSRARGLCPAAVQEKKLSDSAAAVREKQTVQQRELWKIGARAWKSVRSIVLDDGSSTRRRCLPRKNPT
jgi:hypothetical protein